VATQQARLSAAGGLPDQHWQCMSTGYGLGIGASVLSHLAVRPRVDELVRGISVHY
jgi:hypothetical protein